MRLRAIGFTVFSPAELDIKKDGFDPKKDTPLPMSHYMVRDLPLVCNADAIAVLPGWETSDGAKLEVHVARTLGKPIVDAEMLTEVSLMCLSYPHLHALAAASKNTFDEVRTTDPKTGGQKGSKLERFDLIPAEPLEELARVYGRGAAKYSDNNWMKGYKWGLSFAALMRHAWKFWRGESRDELGNSHMACVAWHALTLMWFEKHRPELDDRIDKLKD